MLATRKFALASALFVSGGMTHAVSPTVTYEFTESFIGSVSYSLFTSPYRRYDDLTLVPGGSDLPTLLQTATRHSDTPFYAPPSGQTYCYEIGGCVVTGSNAYGSYSARYWVDAYRETMTLPSDNEYSGTFEFTSGTGVFAGISGGGSFTGREWYGAATSDEVVTTTVVGSMTLPVPEPETWGLMAVGLAIVLGMARRRESPSRTT
ncbi:PEP-CTERM sorting domain-containing protein [Methyloversatilis sp.]|uniref:PEP-CTERM sorting domain-containing protein n=1 Tax=Methyloversatilis sp. TaxID=2569862 RepID=UPI0035B2295D